MGGPGLLPTRPRWKPFSVAWFRHRLRNMWLLLLLLQSKTGASTLKPGTAGPFLELTSVENAGGLF